MVTPDVHKIFQAIHEGSLGNLRLVLEKDGIMKNLCECNERRETPLHAAMRERKFEVIDFLVQNVKDNIQIGCHSCCRIWRQMSPFTWEKMDLEKFSIGPAEFGKEFTQTFVLPSPDVAIVRDIANQINILKLIEYLINVMDDDTSWFEFELNSIAASTMPRLDKITALELMGAAFILNVLLSEQFQLDEISGGLRGLQCWAKALELRDSTANGRLAIPKIPYVLTVADRKAIGDVVEVTTTEQLEELENQLTSHDHRSPIIQQALLVIQRTFAQSGQTEPNLFHLKTLLDFGKQFPTDDFLSAEIHYSRSINISLMIMKHFNRTDSPKCFQVFVEAFLLISDILIGLEHKPLDNAERMKELTFGQLFDAIKFGCKIATNLILLPAISSENESWKLLVMKKIYLLVVALLRMGKLDSSESRQFFKILNNLFSAETLKNGFPTMLHLAIEGFVSQSARIDDTVASTIIKLFLDNGADPKMVDGKGRSALHILAENCPPKSTQQFFDVFQAVLDAGCHLDQSTSDGQTVIAILIQERRKQFQNHLTLDPRVDLWINAVMPLECYCAQKIQQDNVDHHQLPLCLQQFIEKHSSLKGQLDKGESLPFKGFPSGYQIVHDSANFSILNEILNYLRFIFFKSD